MISQLKATCPVPLWKMNGSGNDFVVVDNREAVIPESIKCEWARRVCRPRVSIGAGEPVPVRTTSGRTVMTSFRLSGQAATNVRLGGVAMVVASGLILPDAFDRSGRGLIEA